MPQFKFSTDSEVGTIESPDFQSACDAIQLFLPQSAVDDGAWGWVEDVDGTRFEIGDPQ